MRDVPVQKQELGSVWSTVGLEHLCKPRHPQLLGHVGVLLVRVNGSGHTCSNIHRLQTPLGFTLYNHHGRHVLACGIHCAEDAVTLSITACAARKVPWSLPGTHSRWDMCQREVRFVAVPYAMRFLFQVQVLEDTPKGFKVPSNCLHIQALEPGGSSALGLPQHQPWMALFQPQPPVFACNLPLEVCLDIGFLCHSSSPHHELDAGHPEGLVCRIQGLVYQPVFDVLGEGWLSARFRPQDLFTRQMVAEGCLWYPEGLGRVPLGHSPSFHCLYSRGKWLLGVFVVRHSWKDWFIKDSY